MGGIFILMGLALGGMYVFKTETEYDPKFKDSVRDYLVWNYLYQDKILLNKNGSITRFYKYKCDDMDHQTDEMLFFYRHKLNDILKRFDERYVVQFDSIRKAIKEYPNSEFSEKILQEMDNSRKADYISGKYYESDNYLSITYFPPTDKENKLKSLFISSTSKNHAEEIIKKYNDETTEILNLLKDQFLELEELSQDEITSFLNTCLTGEKRYVKYIKGQYIDDYISDKDLKNEYKNIKLGNKYLKVISLLSHANEHECGMFDELSRLGIEYRWNSRFIYISEEKALKLAKEREKASNSERVEFLEQMADRALEEQVLSESEYALEQKDEASSMRSDIKKGVFATGYYSLYIVLLNENKEALEEDGKKVMTVINERGFKAVDETVNCLEHFFASMPGNIEYGQRNVLSTTYNLLSLVPITMDWDGNRINKHLKKEALLFCQSQDNSSFKFNNHVGDVGHTLVLGMTGGGKSVFLNTLAYQSRKYDSRVIFLIREDQVEYLQELWEENTLKLEKII